MKLAFNYRSYTFLYLAYKNLVRDPGQSQALPPRLCSSCPGKRGRRKKKRVAISRRANISGKRRFNIAAHENSWGELQTGVELRGERGGEWSGRWKVVVKEEGIRNIFLWWKISVYISGENFVDDSLLVHDEYEKSLERVLVFL